MLDKSQENKTKNEFFDNIAIDIFLFIASIISMLAVIVTIHIICRHMKLKALLTGIAFQPVKQSEAVTAHQTKEYCTAQWYAIAALTMMTILLIVYICLSNQKCTIFKRRLYSNTVTIMLFFSDVKQYIPVKLCKSAGSIHLLLMYGQLDSDQIVIEKNCLWDIIRINWKEVFVTLNGIILQMPKTVKIPIRDEYRLRKLMDKHSLLLHIMLRQGTFWYSLDKADFLLHHHCKNQRFNFIFQMAKELSITQDFRMLTLTLPADTVTISVEVKSLKGHYTYSQNNNYTDLSFNPWSEDFQPSETFMRIVREMQIEPNRYYQETIMYQTLCDNFATNCHQPKVTMVEQEMSQDHDTNRQIQSPCPSNWSDYLHVADDMMMKIQTKQNS